MENGHHHQSPNVSLIVIGDEILSGRTQDLNGSWLAKFLFHAGLNFKSLRFIKDNEGDMMKAIDDSFNESDIVITSGGIGPTIDDKTKSTLARYFNKNIIERNDLIPIIEDNYQRFGRPWTPSTNQYHFFPEDFRAIKNPKGLAPGLAYLTSNNKLILSAPGVPREFSEMVKAEFLPLIKETFRERMKENYQTVIRTQGVPEEKIFFEMCPTLWSDLEKFGSVSSLPHTIGIDIVISYKGTEKDFLEKSQKIKDIVSQTPLSTFVWQWGNRGLSELVLNLAETKNLTFGFAESCTGGLLSSKITDLPGASRVFYGGVISYDNSIKKDVLNVSESSLKNFGAVSLEVAREMAEGLRIKLKVDIAISITGIAGPDGGSEIKPVGTVAIGVATNKINASYIFQFPGDRVKLKDRFSEKALLLLFETLKDF